MTNRIKTMNNAELQLIAGGVTEGPDGKGCTDLRGSLMRGGEQSGGPAKVDLSVFGL